MKTPSTKLSVQSGFSLVELLVVIAVIAIIAAIAIPNIANITGSAREASYQRNAQNVASTWSAARAAGYTNSVADLAAAVTALTTGVSVTNLGSGEVMTFRVDALSADQQTGIQEYLSFTNDNIIYNP